MSYFKKSHQHKPKKGKGSYNRINPAFFTPIEQPEALAGEISAEDEQCTHVNTTTVDGATPQKD